MEFTGERYVSSVNGEIKYEHLHRYALSLEFVCGKSVLDLASGEGYGSALLAKVASEVTGVDIDPESVEYAKQQYSDRHNLKFAVGACDSVPLPDESVEVVTSFETIEHHDKHEEMMREIKRVLKPGGLLIISSPNRLTYSDEPNYSNPFHIKELYYDQLVSLLSRYFKYIQKYGQRLATGSFVFPLEDAYETSIKAYTGSTSNLTQQFCSLKSPIYFVAMCSDEAERVRSAIDSLYIDSSDDLLQAFQTGTREIVERLQSQLQQTQAELQQTQAELQQTQAELQQTHATIIVMENSKFWKLRRAWVRMKRAVGVERDG